MDIDDVIGNEYTLGLAERVGNFYNWSLGIGVVLALGIIVYAGVRYAASGGNSSAIDDAKKWITSAVLGLMLLFSTFIILKLINPQLINLKDIEFTANPEKELVITKNMLGLDACKKENIQIAQNTPNYGGTNCGGYYNAQTAPVGNFGDDPTCDMPTLGRAAFREEVRQEIYRDLNILTDYCPRNVTRLTRIMFNVAGGESGYNPNAFSACSTSGHGAFGLFQMNPVNPINPNAAGSTSDRGDVYWKQQVESAILKLRSEGGENYWAQWPEGYSKLIDCSPAGDDTEIQ